VADLGWRLDQVAQWVRGVLHGAADRQVKLVSIDTRQDLQDALFVAIRGDRFDGHDFLAAAQSGGAAAALVERFDSELSLPQIVTSDTTAGLQMLGRARREAFSGPVVGITGSSGKTTTRRILVSILNERYATHQPIRNFNNHVGVPLTLLNLEPGHGAAVMELGCSDFGEIAVLTVCTDPDVALVTNVGPAHLERLGDLDGVARAKGELFAGLREDAIAVVNVDDERVAAMATPAARRLFFGQSGDIDATLVETVPDGLRGQRLVLNLRGEKVEASLPLIGVHNAWNALAAAAAALAVGLGPDDIVQGLARVSPEAGRLEPKPGPRGSVVIDDTYNANPASMRAALSALREVEPAGRRMAVLGDMLELGEASEAAHLDLGRHIAAAGLDLLVGVGPGGSLVVAGAAEAGLPDESRLIAASHEAAASLVRRPARSGDVILVKGSRGMRMDKVVARLVEEES
jgi:UDP-N-acetylmuramoyl-tripeptide--D-alanyl-D-alanine ligase